MDEKKVSMIVLLDMSKLFNDIRHDLMESKLQSIGVSNAPCDWFGSYLSQRNHVANVANSVSEPLPVTVDVVQGSVLGPVLFTLCVNYFLSVPAYCHVMGYVEDTKTSLGLPLNIIA